MAKISSIQIWIRLQAMLTFSVLITDEAVAPPPWANPKLNPCATQPRGWQLLFWPPDGKCYKIFQVGYPCPEDMELSPAAIKSGGSQEEFSAECRCPPKTAQSARDGRCYRLYSLGPCDRGFYFAPDKQYNANNTSKRQWGVCVQTKKCTSPNEIFWPQDGKCYQKLTRGPCPKGQLITQDPDKISVCKCSENMELRDHYYRDGQCYQHFTVGPCRERGYLFLPNRSCGCYNFLPHYHEDTQQCFELGSIGPCKDGEYFYLDPETHRGSCQCKKGYIRFEPNNTCYRPYTQGPCQPGEILVNTTSCIKQPCERGQLYFPDRERCFRIGTRGPCKKGRLVTFDFETRPSIDGISYNGVCSCEKDIYSNNCADSEVIDCDKINGMVRYGTLCYKLYTQGPCPKGAWLVPRRTKKQDLWHDDNDDDDEDERGVCECVPGYTRMLRTFNGRNVTECLSPTVILADYLNNNFSQMSENMFQDQ